MICATALADAPVVAPFKSIAPPKVVGGPAAKTALPTVVNCCVGAAFQRMIPPKVLTPTLICGAVTALVGTGSVVAAMYVF